jgi:hypothetical protein
MPEKDKGAASAKTKGESTEPNWAEMTFAEQEEAAAAMRSRAKEREGDQ